MKVKLENGLKTQKIGEVATGFINTTTVKGKSNRTDVLQRLGLKANKVVQPKYTIIDGVPHKMVNGKFVALTKV